MADREEVAKQVLEYIEAGINDDCMREKYGPAYEGLQSLFEELADAGFMGRAAQEVRAPFQATHPGPRCH